METAPTTTGSHEARARNAKAQALAAVLLELESVETPDDVDLLEPEDWAVAAAEATRRELLGRTASGKVRKVHVPGAGSGDAAATIAAVARILGDLIAHEAEQEQLAEMPRPHADTYERPPVRTARQSAGYRSTLARIAPHPETTEADLTASAFAAFGQAGR